MRRSIAISERFQNIKKVLRVIDLITLSTIISIYKNNSLKKMSTLHHESILEDCLVEAEENFRISNKLTQKQLDELIVRSEGVRLAIEKQAQKLFNDRCI